MLFVTYYSNVSLFTHTHIIHGTTIVHSHWHLQKHHATADGGHRTHEVTLITNLCKYLCLESTPCCFSLAPASSWVSNIKTAYSAAVTRVVLTALQLRAPPVV